MPSYIINPYSYLSVAPDPSFASVSFLSGFEAADGTTALNEESSHARAMTFVNQAQVDTAQAKFGQSSLLLDGTADVVTLANNADFQFGSGEFTVEGFMKINTYPGAGATSSLVCLFDTNNQRSWDCRVLGASGAAALGFVYSTTGANQTITHETVGFSDTGTWMHFAFGRDGSNVIRTHWNGTFKEKATNANTFFASTAKLSLGGRLAIGVPSDRYLNGWLDEVRITKGVCRYPSDSDFTPTTTAYARN